MRAQALAAEVDALAILIAVFAFEAVSVGAFIRDAIGPQRLLCGADVG